MTKSPNILLDDVDLGKAIPTALAIAFLNSGQACAAGTRFLEALGEITVLRGVETFGGSGESQVKGVVTNLSAVALSVKPEGSVRTLRVGGGLITHGPGIAPLELLDGVESLQVKDEAIALGWEKDVSK